MSTISISAFPLNAGRVGRGRFHRLATVLFAFVALLGLTLGTARAQEEAAAEPTPAVQAGEAHAEHAEGGHEKLTQHAPLLYDGKFFKINNSMVASWIVAALLILGARGATRHMKEVPEGAQNFWEWMVESLYEFLAGLIGHDLVKKTFWFFATIFIVILFTNWFGLIPGVGTFGWGTPDEHGALHFISHPVLRGGNADLNMTLAMSIVFFACWTIWALQANGPGGFILHLFGPKGDTKGMLKVLMIIVFIGVGVLEVVTILFRPVTLSFRLYGNVFAGENMLETMAHMGGTYFGWLMPIPFYFLELIVGVVQALVFMLLTAVFTLLICTHDEEHASH